MKYFTVFDIRIPRSPLGRDRRRADTGCPGVSFDACQPSSGAQPANAATPCGFLSAPY